MNKQIILWILFIISGIWYYVYTEDLNLTGETIKEIRFVERVIDGDTLELENGDRIRMLGINTPEKTELLGQNVKLYTKQLEGKNISVEIIEKDKYGRYLSYVFYEDKMFNEQILENGLAHFYSYEDDKYSDKLRKAEENARKKELGIWEKSQNYGCVSIVEFNYVEQGKRCTNGEKLVLQNLCSSINISLKDDATHIEHITLENGLFEKDFSCVWNDAGDTLFIWDDYGLVLFYRY